MKTQNWEILGYGQLEERSSPVQLKVKAAELVYSISPVNNILL